MKIYILSYANGEISKFESMNKLREYLGLFVEGNDISYRIDEDDVPIKFINLTPHEVKLNDGRVFPSEGVARVSNSFTNFTEDICEVKYGEVEGLPFPEAGTRYIVSALVLSALKGKRADIVAPATGHPDCIREKGFIVSVPGFVR